MIKQIFGWDEVLLPKTATLERGTLSAAPLLPLFIGLLTANLIVCPPFIWVRKTSHRRVDLFKCICWLGRWVLIRVYLDGASLERFFQINLSTIPFNAQYLIVVFASNDFLAHFDVFGRELALLLLGHLHGWFGWRWRGLLIWLLPEKVEALKQYLRLCGFKQFYGLD